MPEFGVHCGTSWFMALRSPQRRSATAPHASDLGEVQNQTSGSVKPVPKRLQPNLFATYVFVGSCVQLGNEDDAGGSRLRWLLLLRP